VAVLDFGTPERTMRLRSVHPGVEVCEVVAATGFPLAVPDRVPVTRWPTGEELGLIASATMSLGELAAAIAETAGRTSAPFGVNLRADAPDAAERVKLIIAGHVPVASFAQAPKPELIAALKEAGVVTIASAGARRHAEKAVAWGIDAVIATGSEGGGHVGAVPTSLLIPQVAAAVGVPVIAAGGDAGGLWRAAMVDGRTDLGLMSSGQVAGLIDDLPSCEELIAAIVRDAEAGLERITTFRSAEKI
jgi:NAD(P)H-dependent flavin oxidoreductase YrpB (nitropropane dioxygenase family)